MGARIKRPGVWAALLLVLIGVIVGAVLAFVTAQMFEYVITPTTTIISTLTEPTFVTKTVLTPTTMVIHETMTLTDTVTLVKTSYVTRTVTKTVSTTVITTAAPDFTLPEVNKLGLTGENVKLSQFSGKPVFLEFISPTCIHSLKETPVVSELYRRYGGKVIFISIVIGSVEAAKDLLQTYEERTWVHVLDSSGEVFKSYGIKGVPTYIVLNTDHVEVGRFVGAGTEVLAEEILRTIS